jgi:hypothetical protein
MREISHAGALLLGKHIRTDPLRETKYPGHLASLSKHIRATLTRYIFSSGNVSCGCPAVRESYPDPMLETKYPAHMASLSKHIRATLTRYIFSSGNIPCGCPALLLGNHIRTDPLRETKLSRTHVSHSKYIQVVLTRYIFSAGNVPCMCSALAAREVYLDPLRETKYTAHMLLTQNISELRKHSI